jgi:predicted RNA-binding Zn-ribbon protein involved in translation (DUF1610 family)
MGEIKGYVCSKCNFEKIYFLGVGFLNKREVKLFECKDCEAIKKSVISKPKCSKCNKKSINEVINFNTKLKCPKCGEIEFRFEIDGMWD